MNQNFSTIQQLAQHLSSAKPATVGSPPAAPVADTSPPRHPDGQYKNMHILDIREHTKKIIGRLLIVGDIHGCPDQLENLLQSVNFVQGIDQLVIAGDFVNKGPDSIGAVQKAIEYGAMGVLGNHDWTLLDIHSRIASGEIQPFNKKHARDPFVRIARELPDVCLRYLSSLPHVLKIPQYNLMVVHAGINPSYPLHQQSIRDLTHIRRLEMDPETQSFVSYEGGSSGEQWATQWRGPETIIFGHDARRGLQVEPHAYGLDTGCCYGGNLTGLLFPGAKLVSVPGVARRIRPPEDEEAADDVPQTPTTSSTRDTSPAPFASVSSGLQQQQQPQPAAGRNGTPLSVQTREAFPTVPSIQQLFDNARRTMTAVSTSDPTQLAGLRSRVTPPSPVAALTTSSDSCASELASLSALASGNCAPGLLLLLCSPHYDKRFMAMLSAAETDVAALAVWTSVLRVLANAAGHGGSDTSEIIRFVVDILDGRPNAATKDVVASLNEALVRLECASAAAGGVPKSVVKSLKLTLRSL
jgi:bis(5'-nucleosyl)-tetraphosphatase (symmetrical)